MPFTAIAEVPVNRGELLSKATGRAADRLGLTAAQLSDVIGLSEPTISRMRRGEFKLDEAKKPFELAALLVRLCRSLDAIVDGDPEAMKAWMKNHNTVLGGKPVERITSISGLVDVVAYLDSRRALG